MSKIAFTYNASANPSEGSYPGVPLADITDDEFNALPRHIKRTLLASPLYERQKGVRLDLSDDQPKAAADADAPSEPASKSAPAKEAKQ